MFLGLLIRLLIVASIHIYRGATGQLQANRPQIRGTQHELSARTQRSQLFYVGVAIAAVCFFLSLVHFPLATLGMLAGMAIAVTGYLTPTHSQIEHVDGGVASNGMDR